MDRLEHKEIDHKLSDKISMCNYYANRLVCEAADRAMQVHGGIGYSRHKPFEHIYRHHRRYRITEGAEEIQMRKVGAYLFGYLGPRKALFQGWFPGVAAQQQGGNLRPRPLMNGRGRRSMRPEFKERPSRLSPGGENRG